MKKIFFFVFCIGCLQARLYIGIDTAYAVQSEKTVLMDQGKFALTSFDLSVIDLAFANRSKGFAFGISVGSEEIVGNVFGTRWGGSLGYASIYQHAQNQFVARDYLNLGLNFDLMLDFFNNGSYSIGIFGGGELEYVFWINMNSNLNTLSAPHFLFLQARTGMSFLLAKHHRIDLFAKLPFFALSVFGGNKSLLGGHVLPARTMLGVGYRFVF